MIKTLVKIRLSALFTAMMTPRKKKAKGNAAAKPGKGMLILYICLYVYLGICLIGLFAGLFLGLTGMLADGNALGYFMMYAMLSFLLMVIGSVFMAKSQIFEAKDNDLLLSMPIKPRDILLSRILPILFFNYLYEFVVALPAFVVWFFAGRGTFTLVRVLIFFLISFLLPIFTMAFSGLFAWGISAITSRIKRKNLMTVVFSLAFIGAYFYFYFTFLQNTDEIVDALGALAGSLGRIPPLLWIGSAIADANLLHLLFSLAFLILPTVLVYWLLERSFISLVTAKSGTTGLKKKTDYQSLKSASPERALLRRELSRFFGSATYLLNDGLGLPMIIGITAVYLFNKDRILAAFSDGGNELLTAIAGDLLGGIMVAILTFMNSLCLITAPSVSLEGKTLWILRSMPVDAGQVLRAKLNFHYALTVPVLLVCAVLTIAVVRPSLPVCLMLILIPSLFAIWGGNIGLICGLHHPLFDWQNETIPCKQGTAILLSMLFITLPALVLLVVGAIGFILSPWICLVGCVLLLTVGDLLTYRYLMKRGTVLWDEF